MRRPWQRLPSRVSCRIDDDRLLPVANRLLLLKEPDVVRFWRPEINVHDRAVTSSPSVETLATASLARSWSRMAWPWVAVV